MRHLTIDVSNYDSRLHIGKQGENLTREITFDCASWLDGLTGGVLSIVHQRPSDPDAYPCGDYVTDDTSLTWSINETDVAFSGLGKCELRYTIGSRIAKTKTFYTEIVNALNPLDTPPEAYEPYIDRVIDAATQEMENMTVSASATSGEQTSVDVTKTRENDHEHIAFNFTVEKGDKGEKGEDGKSIVNVTAAIDANVGTPSVTVTTSSSDAGLSVDLDFHNMKGIPGASFDTSYLPSDTASGSPATFTDGAKNVPVDELVTTIVPQQDLHGYSKPWPAGGGKNICPNVFISQTINGVTITVNNDGSVHCKGLASADVAFNITNAYNYIKLKANTEYTMSGCPANGGSGAWRLRLTTTPTGSASLKDDNGDGRTFTVEQDTSAGMRILVFVGNDVDFTYYPMVELGSSATDYEPYANVCPISGFTQAEIAHNGDTDTIPFGQTVYGGELNVTNGVLTINTIYAEFDGTEPGWSWNTNEPRSFRIARGELPQNSSIICNILEATKSSSLARYGIIRVGVTNIVAYTELNQTEWTNMLGQYGLQLVCELATPTTVQLTPDEVRTVLGNNSISANTGSVSVRYRADIGLYIDKKLA